MYMVQRLNKHYAEMPERPGIDRHFSLDYMGRSEFEWGYAKTVLTTMRTNPKDIIQVKVEHGKKKEKRKGYFVGPAAALAMAKQFFADQVANPPADAPFKARQFKLIEPSYMMEAYQEEKRCSCIGWWVQDEAPPWAIFKWDDDARLWKTAVYGPQQPEVKNEAE